MATYLSRACGSLVMVFTIVGAFQPETTFHIFNRALFNKDIATGDSTVNDEYSTSGAASV
ncbi:hypothetical protein LTR56_012491 [Elasticomyces elasticus]|nr:hypothetical protein LTR56_012491 [Elasticomyces elasticus]KAK3666214.1 hypothetical protein LTR22_002878 [Elasticomyces elasticus]KAK4926811.1 hypothetical protein LTR49_006227 [Elasticomyces elasticus]KAK5763646.1 hypothetical protein LTS12_006203 [Elasticomyces elasticus]